MTAMEFETPVTCNFISQKRRFSHFIHDKSDNRRHSDNYPPRYRKNSDIHSFRNNDKVIRREFSMGDLERRLKEMEARRQYREQRKLSFWELLAFGKKFKRKSKGSLSSSEKHVSFTGLIDDDADVFPLADNQRRFEVTSGPKRFSEGDLQDAQNLSSLNNSGKSEKFKKLTKSAVISARFRGRRASEIEGKMAYDVANQNRRGTVHGNQLFFNSNGKLKRRVDEPNAKSRLTTMLTSAVLAKERERRRIIRKFRTIGNVVGRVCCLHKTIIERNSTDIIYKSQLEAIGSSPVNEKNTYGANRIDVSYFKANRQMRMSQRGLQILSKPPLERTKDDIRYATNALRNVKYIAEFPLKIQESLARVGFIECYDAKRFIVKEGGSPENAYIVLYGSIVTAILDDHKLSATSINVLIKRGQPFGEIGVFKNQPRGGSNITNEYTEVLRIQAEDYKKIFMGGTLVSPERDPFLKKFSFLRNWPLKALKEEPGKYFVTYFQRNVTLTKDSNKSDWIYLVKEGSLRVLKRLEKVKPTVNKRTGQYSELAHPSGYFSFLSRTQDFDRYASYHDLNLPPPLQADCDACDDEHYDDGHSFNVYSAYDKKDKQNLTLMKRLESVLRPHTAGRFLVTPDNDKYREDIKPPRTAFSEIVTTKKTLDQSVSSTPSPALANITETPGEKKGIELKTIFDDLDGAREKENYGPLPELNGEAEWVHVQTLTKDQVFGLQYVVFDRDKQPQPSFIVVSNGAEVVQISRTLFLSKLNFDGREKLRNKVSPYPTDEELQNNLITRVNWESYKDIVLQQLVRDKTRRKTTRPKTSHISESHRGRKQISI